VPRTAIAPMGLSSAARSSPLPSSSRALWHPLREICRKHPYKPSRRVRSVHAYAHRNPSAHHITRGTQDPPADFTPHTLNVLPAFTSAWRLNPDPKHCKLTAGSNDSEYQIRHPRLPSSNTNTEETKKQSTQRRLINRARRSVISQRCNPAVLEPR